jgi:molybdate transport system permease protein
MGSRAPAPGRAGKYTVSPPLRPAGRRLAFPFAAGAAALVLAIFLALPLIGLLVRVSPAAMWTRLGEPQVLAALRLSLITSSAATLLVGLLGVPTAYLLATRSFRGKAILETLVELPMVLPPTVAGFALLMAFGRMGLAGRALAVFGVSLPFTTLGVIVAQVFMSAPFFIAPARAGFEGVDRRFLDAAATLRASEARRFLHVMLPLAAPSLVAGITLSAARALGEFGATITFAGNLPGVTQTLPLSVYIALQSDLDTAVVLSTLLVLTSLGLLAGLRGVRSGWFGGEARARHSGPAQAR